MKNLTLTIVLICAVSLLLGCTTAQKGAGIGALGGAAVGTGIAAASGGHLGIGAGVGAAAGAITGALVGEQMDTKFCPVCGAAYTSGVKYCPKDGAELKFRQK